jgi:hypothetical protein
MPAPRSKSDTVDAEETARAVLAGYALAEPKAATGRVERVRQLRSAAAARSRPAAGAVNVGKGCGSEPRSQWSWTDVRSRRLTSAGVPRNGKQDPGRFKLTRELADEFTAAPPGPPVQDRSRGYVDAGRADEEDDEAALRRQL